MCSNVGMRWSGQELGVEQVDALPGLAKLNNLVRSVKNYKAQEVKGGLGTGGRLGVQGGSTPASKGIGN